MSKEDPPKLDYADPELPRPSVPPDGYLGYRSDEPRTGTQVGCIGWVIIIGMTLIIIYIALWMLGRWLKSRGI